jgi:predicted dehydrogenase
MNQVIRFGVIGLRRGQSFTRVCQAVGGATVTALYDIDTGRVAQAAAALNARPFTDLNALLNTDIDAVIIASPVPFHVHRALDYTLPGVFVSVSAEAGSAPQCVPDSRSFG